VPPYLEGLDGEELGSNHDACLVPWGCIESLVLPVQIPVPPLRVSTTVKAIGISLTTLQAFSFVTFFIHPAKEWFRGVPATNGPLSPQ
jgi:hypothetical protein